MCTTPCGTCFFSFFLNVFFLPFFSGVAAPETSTGLAMLSILSSKVYLTAVFFLFATVPLRGPLRVRGLGWVRCPRAGGRGGGGRLSARRQMAAVTRAAVRADLDEALDVHGGVLAQVAFHVAL